MHRQVKSYGDIRILTRETVDGARCEIVQYESWCIETSREVGNATEIFWKLIFEQSSIVEWLLWQLFTLQPNNIVHISRTIEVETINNTNHHMQMFTSV